MIVQFRPLRVWPYPNSDPRRWRPFKSAWEQTLNDMRREIRLVDGDNVVIAAGFRERDIRNDGWPRSDARQPDHPGVEVSFDSRHGRLVYATDVCSHWEDNVRSIALGLEALRAVDRYGISRRGQQYAGWRALPAGPSVDNLPGTKAQAEAVIREVLGDPKAKVDEAAIREAIKKAHPDTGGDGVTFRRVQAAKVLMEGP